MEPQRIPPDEVQRRVEAGERVTFVDTRSADAWNEASMQVPGSIRVPPDEVDQHLHAEKPQKKRREPDPPPRDRGDDRDEDEAPETPPTEPEPAPVEEPPDAPGTRRGPYVVMRRRERMMRTGAFQ